MVAGFRKGCKAERPWPDVRPALLESLIAARELNQINLTLNLREPAGVAGYLAAHAERLRAWLRMTSTSRSPAPRRVRQTTLPAERARRSQVRRRYGWVGLLAVPIHRRNRMSEQPATDAGTTRPAGAGVDDQELASQVGEQTSSDLQAEDVFERESGGATTDTEAAKADGDDLT
jgi:hypothetical protein